MKRFHWLRKPKKSSDEADLTRYFTALDEMEANASFESVTDWITRVARSDGESAPLRYKRRNPMYEFLNTYRSRLALTSLGLAVVFVSCTMPVEQEETFGYMLSGMIDGTEAASVTERFESIDWIQREQLNLALVAPAQGESGTLDASALTFRFAIAMPEVEKGHADDRARQIAGIPGVTDTRVEPMSVLTEKPAYKVVLDTMLPKDANSFNADESRVASAVIKHLDELKMYRVQVDQREDGSGRKVLVLTPPADMGTPEIRTLKQFMADTAPEPVHQATPAVQIAALTQEIGALQKRMDATGAGPAREKMETYLKQLNDKLEALRIRQSGGEQ